MTFAIGKKKQYLALGLSVFVFLLLMVPFIGYAQEEGLVPCDGPDCGFYDFIQLAKNIINFLMFTVAVPVATLLFMWAGFKYLTAGDDMGQVKKAHGIFVNVFTGLLIALGAWLVVNLLTTTLLGKDVTEIFN